MGLKFKNQNSMSVNNTLKVYFYTETITVSNDSYDSYESWEDEEDIVITYHIAAATLDAAIDIWIEKYSDIKWKDKTREDFNRQDHWEAWVDHNREKTYNTYMNKISKLKKKLKKSMMEIPGVFYIGKPCTLLKTQL